MKQNRILSGTLICFWSVAPLAAEETANEIRPIPATRPEMKAALEALKDRQPRLPAPAVKDGTPANADTPARHLPDSWGGEGGLGSLRQSNNRANYFFSDPCFWVVSRGNNCQYCLGHQELRLLASGMPDDTVAALDCDWSQFDPRQQAALAFARKLTLEPEYVGDDDVDRLKQRFSDPEIIELVFAIAGFNAINRWTDGMGLPLERRFSDDRPSTLVTPTSEKFQHTKSIVIPTMAGPGRPWRLSRKFSKQLPPTAAARRGSSCPATPTPARSWPT